MQGRAPPKKVQLLVGEAGNTFLEAIACTGNEPKFRKKYHGTGKKERREGKKEERTTPMTRREGVIVELQKEKIMPSEVSR